MSIDEIIAGMTEAQKRAILSMPDKHLDRWNRRVRHPTHRALFRNGLIAHVPLRPTPLGLSVRARLEETND